MSSVMFIRFNSGCSSTPPNASRLGCSVQGLTPEPQLEAIYARNLEKYGDKLGPTVEWLRAKGKSWEQIIESASRSGGKDLGF